MVDMTNFGFSSHNTGYGRQPGFFLLDDESCIRQSYIFTREMTTEPPYEEKDGGCLFPAGAVVIGEESAVLGIVYEDVFIPAGVNAAAGSLVVGGVLDVDKHIGVAGLAEDPRFKISNSGNVVRPYGGGDR